jgi:hypothetical protein
VYSKNQAGIEKSLSLELLCLRSCYKFLASSAPSTAASKQLACKSRDRTTHSRTVARNPPFSEYERMADPSGAVDADGSAERQFVNSQHLMHNTKIITTCRTSLCALAGIATGETQCVAMHHV